MSRKRLKEEQKPVLEPDAKKRRAVQGLPIKSPPAKSLYDKLVEKSYGFGKQESWKPFLDSYLPHQQIELAFETDADAKKAISLLWGPELYECPHQLTPDGVIVPSPAVEFFRHAGLKFSEHQISA